jgi:hypothetical protein
MKRRTSLTLIKLIPFFQPESADSEPAAGARHLKAQSGRRRRHNEQIIIAPCGVILDCATFFGAESIPSCVVHENQTVILGLQFSVATITRNSSNKFVESMDIC